MSFHKERFFLKVALAEKTAVLFTKDGDQHNNLHDMQCMWYVLFHLIVTVCIMELPLLNVYNVIR